MSDKKYIDAEELNKLLSEAKNNILVFNGGICKAKMIVREMPAADVEEVRHGEWVPIEQRKHWADTETVSTSIIGFRCSLCGAEEKFKYKYCHCGARMNKEKEE